MKAPKAGETWKTELGHIAKLDWFKKGETLHSPSNDGDGTPLADALWYADGTHIFSGNTGNLVELLEPAKPVKKTPNYRLIALRMSKARTIGEAREIYKRGVK